MLCRSFGLKPRRYSSALLIVCESGFSPAVSKARVTMLVTPVRASFSTSAHEPSSRCWPFKKRTPSRIARSTSSRVTAAADGFGKLRAATIRMSVTQNEPQRLRKSSALLASHGRRSSAEYSKTGFQHS